MSLAVQLGQMDAPYAQHGKDRIPGRALHVMQYNSRQKAAPSTIHSNVLMAVNLTQNNSTYGLNLSKSQHALQRGNVYTAALHGLAAPDTTLNSRS
jgi:hypothetical protein